MPRRRPRLSNAAGHVAAPLRPLMASAAASRVATPLAQLSPLAAQLALDLHRRYANAIEDNTKLDQLTGRASFGQQTALRELEDAGCALVRWKTAAKQQIRDVTLHPRIIAELVQSHDCRGEGCVDGAAIVPDERITPDGIAWINLAHTQYGNVVPAGSVYNSLRECHLLAPERRIAFLLSLHAARFAEYDGNPRSRTPLVIKLLPAAAEFFAEGHTFDPDTCPVCQGQPATTGK